MLACGTPYALILQQHFESDFFMVFEPDSSVRGSSGAIASQVVLDNLKGVLFC